MSISTAKTFEPDSWMKARPMLVDADGFRLTDEVMHLPPVLNGRSRGMVKSTNAEGGIIEPFDGGHDVRFKNYELRGTEFVLEGDIVDYTAGSIGVRNTATLVMVVHRA
ncbi:MAG: hypothetical protein K2X77_33665 [Candidatus Obscuribacterales bacterium]|nr:hypothetical protein [Candidatus Obscuribacterales bacterium]